MICLGSLEQGLCFSLQTKSKDGLEAKEYTSLKEIKALFQQELKGGGSVASAAASSSSNPEPETEAQASLEEQSDPMWIAKSNGFVIGKIFTEKGKSAPHKLVALNDGGAVFTEITFESATPIIQTVGFDQLMKWSEFKGGLQTIVEGHDKQMVHNLPHFDLEAEKCIAFAALLELAQKWRQTESFHVKVYMGPG